MTFSGEIFFPSKVLEFLHVLFNQVAQHSPVFFFLHLSEHWGDLIEQIKEKSVIYTLRKHQKIKAKNTPKTNSKRNRKMFSPPDETIPCSERKMKVVHPKKPTKTRQ